MSITQKEYDSMKIDWQKGATLETLIQHINLKRWGGAVAQYEVLTYTIQDLQESELCKPENLARLADRIIHELEPKCDIYEETKDA